MRYKNKIRPKILLTKYSADENYRLYSVYPWCRKEEMTILLQVYDNFDNLERGRSLIHWGGHTL